MDRTSSSEIQYIAVFCASSNGKDPEYLQMASDVGRFLAGKGIGVIYGGSKAGLMGALAEGALDAGGEVIGVIPGFLTHHEIAHTGITELIEVESMHERKLEMHKLSDAVIALPGGFGTMEEMFEMLTWGQLGLHQKPMGLLNFKGYFDHLLAFIRNMHREGLLREQLMDMVLQEATIAGLLEQMHAYESPISERIMDRGQT